MFIRKSKKIDHSTNQEYYSYHLVESYRTEKGPRQRFLLNLGNGPQHLDKHQLKALANRIEEIISGQKTFIKYEEEIEKLAQFYAKQFSKQQVHRAACTEFEEEEIPEYVTVDLKSLSNEDCRSIGAEYTVYSMLCTYGLPNKLKSLGLPKKKIDIIIANIIARAVSPSSELSTYDWLNNYSALGELMGVDFSEFTLYQLYQSADNLMKHKEAIEEHLSSVSKGLFNLKENIILYDITNTYFEGLASGNKKAKHGKSKEKRTDCPLVSMGLVVDIDGFPKHSETFDGNVQETKTFQEMIRKLDRRGEFFKPTVVMDAGIASEENIQWLKDKKYPYIVVSRRKTQPMPTDGIPVIVKEKEGEVVTVVKKQDEKTKEIFVYCHSEGRERREKGMKSKREQAFEEGLIKLNNGLQKPTSTIKDYKKVVERIGRLKEKYKKVASYYIIDVKKCEKTERATEITWKKDKEKESKKHTGAYCLRTMSSELSEKDIWETYTMLTELEDAFRFMKSELGMRPVYHRLEGRVDGHLFITLIAYQITHAIRKKLKTQQINKRWEHVRLAMSTQQRMTTILKRPSGAVIQIRNTSRANEFQRSVYDALSLSHIPLRSVEIGICNNL